jgi:hypothetical protein
MKIFLLFCFYLLLAQTSFSQNEGFYKQILTEQISARNGYFIALNVKSNTYNGKVIITNGYLQYFLTQTRKFNEKQYNEFMTKLLVNKDVLPLKNATLLRDGYFIKVKGFNAPLFMPVRNVDEVEEAATKGCEKFIDHYFDKKYLMLKNAIGDVERNAVVNKLFEWQIPSFVSDIPGMLVINDNYKCPQ